MLFGGVTHSASVELKTVAGVLPSGPNEQNVSFLLSTSAFQSNGKKFEPLR